MEKEEIHTNCNFEASSRGTLFSNSGRSSLSFRPPIEALALVFRTPAEAHLSFRTPTEEQLHSFRS
ncbi:hypothetical protein C0J52_28412 [Blattella germanica]|nr:hypothetical protein C0J52_28412 [Blattella germanica]